MNPNIVAVFSCLLMPVAKGPVAVPSWKVAVGAPVPLESTSWGRITGGDVMGLSVEAYADARGVRRVTIKDNETGEFSSGTTSAEVYKPKDENGVQKGLRLSCRLDPPTP